ncbi:hypothetical protein BGZ68_005430 [Mortierella alpina]|nr:hypothetical protein BGZ68_005430 [Mortierella alpina]
MPSSPTHNIIRALQLALSISIVATAAFLLHYRTQAHSNFTNEPLVSCISGGVAFIYAVWAILNHRRQPDNHRWRYLHGLGCVVVAGLLIAGSVLAFVLGNRGVLCQQLEDADDVKSTRRTVVRRDLPEYEDGRQYGPRDRCENFYAEMDKANAVMGIVAAVVWMVDFGLIFGLCGSSGRYGPHRDYPARRGQIAPEDEDYYPAGEGSRRTRGPDDFDPQEDYYDTLDQRKMALDWLEQKNRAGSRSMDDPRNHVQGPIPLAMRQNLSAGGAATNNSELPLGASGNSPNYLSGATSATTLSPDQHHVETGETESTPGIVITTLSPPPLPRPRWIQPPDSPTLPAQRRFQEPQLSFSKDGVSLTEEEPTIPADSKPHRVHPPLQPLTIPEPESDLQISSTASSPRYVEFPPGPACYVFESSQQEFLPSYVNMAARFEQKQTLKQFSPASSTSSTVSGAGTPTRRSNTGQRRIVVTGLGFDVSSRDEAEIAADEAEQAKSRDTAEANSTATHSRVEEPGQGMSKGRDSADVVAAAAIASPGSVSERPWSVKMPNAPTPLSAPPASSHASTSPASAQAAEPLSSPQSVSSRDSRQVYNNVVGNATSTNSSTRASTASNGSNSSGTSAFNKKPAMTKRKTSKLSVVTLKNGLQNINGNSNSNSISSTGIGNGGSSNALNSAGTGLNSTATSAVGTPSAELSPAMRSTTVSGGNSPLRSVSPRSPYRGDF